VTVGHPPRAARLVAALVAALAAVLSVGVAPAAAAEPEWNIARVGAPAAASGTVVAVVDTGVDAGHPTLAGRVLPAIDLTGGNGGDGNGHGTHVAGTAAGADAGCGAIGVAPDARILPVRVLDEEGEGTVGDVAEGIRRAADAGAAVINLSLGSDVVLRNVAGSGLEDAIRYAWSKGSIPVLAAGNDGLFGGVFGSGYRGIPAVVVTATDNRDRVAPYATSIGSADWGIAAPGGDGSGEVGRDILSAFPDDRCALLAGTSMAAPHVAGALAVLRSRGLTPQQAVDRVLDTAREIGSSSTYGHGLLDLRAALDSLAAPPTAATAVTTTTAAASAPSTTAGAAPASPTTTRPAAVDASPGGAEPAESGPDERAAPDPGSAPSSAPASSPPTSEPPSTTAVDESAQSVVVVEDDAQLPGAVVLVAVAGVLGMSAATGVAAWSRRRSLG